MKTKEQVIEHLKTVGYTHVAITKIMGFLIGNGQKEMQEVIHYLKGQHTFEDFMSWYQSEDEQRNDECPVCEMFRHLFTAMDMATEENDIEMLDELDSMLDIMLDIFVVDENKRNDECPVAPEPPVKEAKKPKCQPKTPCNE